MGTVRTAPPTSLEGLTLYTSQRSADDPARGSLYNPATLAAAAPVHFHPLTATSYVMVFSHRWYNATPDPAALGRYTAHTEDPTPCWVRIHASGAPALIGGGYEIPGTENTTLVGACTRGTYLYVLSVDGLDSAVITQLYWNTGREIFVPVAQETLPMAEVGGHDVAFTRGIYIDGAHVVLVGAEEGGEIFLARKAWGKIGAWRLHDRAGWDLTARVDDVSWEYREDTGWSTDPALATPLNLSTAGPVSVSRKGRTLHYAVVEADGDTRTGRIWSSTDTSPVWRDTGITADLGTAGSTYLGGTLQLQSQLHADGIPCVTTVLESGGLNVIWSTATV